MSDVPQTVFIVDDDSDSRDSLAYLISAVGLKCQASS